MSDRSPQRPSHTNPQYTPHNHGQPSPAEPSGSERQHPAVPNYMTNWSQYPGTGNHPEWLGNSNVAHRMKYVGCSIWKTKLIEDGQNSGQRQAQNLLQDNWVSGPGIMSHKNVAAPHVVNLGLAAEGSRRRQQDNATHGSEQYRNTTSRRPHESARPNHGGQTVQPQHGSSQHPSIQTPVVDRLAAPTGAHISGLQWIAEPGSHRYQPDSSRRSRSTPYGGRPTAPQPGQSLFVVN